MKHKIALRLILDIPLAFAVIEGWWFAALPLGLIGAWAFPYYFEIFIAGVVYDSLFGLVPDMGIKGYAGMIVATAVLSMIGGFKKVTRR